MSYDVSYDPFGAVASRVLARLGLAKSIACMNDLRTSYSYAAVTLTSQRCLNADFRQFRDQLCLRMC